MGNISKDKHYYWNYFLVFLNFFLLFFEKIK